MIIPDAFDGGGRRMRDEFFFRRASSVMDGETIFRLNFLCSHQPHYTLGERRAAHREWVKLLAGRRGKESKVNFTRNSECVTRVLFFSLLFPYHITYSSFCCFIPPHTTPSACLSCVNMPRRSVAEDIGGLSQSPASLAKKEEGGGGSVSRAREGGKVVESDESRRLSERSEAM